MKKKKGSTSKSSQPTEQQERQEKKEKQDREAERWRRFVWAEGDVTIYPPEEGAGSKQRQPKPKRIKGKGPTGVL